MTEKELLEALLQEVKSVREDQQSFQFSLNELKTDVSQLKTDVSQLKTDVHELKTDFDEHRAYVTDQFTSAFEIFGGLQGDIEEIQNDTQYLSMRKLIDKRDKLQRKLLER